MRRPDGFSALPHRCGYHSPRRPGYTLVEILTATVLMIIIMLAVTVIFASVTESIGQSRATLEMTQRLRSASALLKQDLENVTVAMTPPAHPRDNSGYFEYVEGPIGPVVVPENVAWNIDNNAADSTVGDIDDILMFTAKTEGEPYVGLVTIDVNGVPTPTATKSNTAEIIWFVRGRTLYRRVLLVKPDASVIGGPGGFYATNDLSVRKDWRLDGTPYLAANTLADLTKPECRFGHHPDPRIWTAWNTTNRYASERRPHPFFLPPWNGRPYTAGGTTKWVPGLNLPILAECSASTWNAGEDLWNSIVPTAAAPNDWYDAWANPHPWADVDRLTGILTAHKGMRIGEDVVLTNVIGFDVKAWDPYAPILPDASGNVFLLPGDPGYNTALKAFRNSMSGAWSMPTTGAYADLNYMAEILFVSGAYPDAPAIHATGRSLPVPLFHRPGDYGSRVYGTLPPDLADGPSIKWCPAVYDTWSLHYEFNRRQMRFTPGGPLEEVGDEDGVLGFDQGSDGIDNDGKDGVDDVGERETQPPYAVPLQGIQVRIRTFEPGSRQVREVTLVQKFRTR
ncbi:MAG: PulJ/GspJ family protein [Thermoguttaceae bacterium]|jgi:type II secretory pathway pseudopilin PulG